MDTQVLLTVLKDPRAHDVQVVVAFTQVAQFELHLTQFKPILVYPEEQA